MRSHYMINGSLVSVKTKHAVRRGGVVFDIGLLLAMDRMLVAFRSVRISVASI